MHIMRTIAFVLAMVGAIAWGLVGLFNYNIVSAIFGEASLLSRIVYSLVGIAGVYLIATTEQEECLCDCSERTEDY